MSLYFTFSVAKNIPIEKLRISPYNTKTGNIKNSIPGTPEIISLQINKIKKDIKKSIKHTIKDEAGMMIFGKYTFVSMFEFATSELLISVTADETKPQIIIPEETAINRFCKSNPFSIY